MKSNLREMRRKQRVRKNIIKGVTAGVLILGVSLTAHHFLHKAPETVEADSNIPVAGVSEVLVETVAQGAPDFNNYVYPYNTMSADWGSELYESGFKYYEIPTEYKEAGGCFPEVVQAYLWCTCKDAGVDYYTVVALIERESGYKWFLTGDDGNSKGYMQVYEKWHLERMISLDVNDLHNPYQNIKTGVNILKEIQDKYLESSGENCVLMVYNMGETTAKKKWNEGVFSTEYSRGILKRAKEIKQELEQE